MKSELLPNSFTDKIADPAERARIVGSPLPSDERHAAEDSKVERELHKLIWNELTRRGILFVHSRLDRKTTQARGVPDFVACIIGLFCAFECKTATGTLSKEQEAVRLEIIRNGGRYYLVRSFAEFRAALSDILVLQHFREEPQCTHPNPKPKDTDE